jgi:hypothetical protein
MCTPRGNLPPMNGRAITYAEKLHVLARVADAWERVPQLRLGQLIDCVIYDVDAAGGPDLFNIEDKDLVESIEEFAAMQNADKEQGEPF